MRYHLPWLITLLVGACDSPQLVSFNTPEQCKASDESAGSFTEAEKQCKGGDCQICIETVRGDRALSYAIVREEGCVCAPPVNVGEDSNTDSSETGNTVVPARDAATLDAGLPLEAPDAASAFVDAAASPVEAGSKEPEDECSSRLNLTHSAARSHCSHLSDCHVCVQRVDYEGDARSYLAHQCGCPAPYRVD